MSEQRRDVGAVQGTVETSAGDAGEAIAALRAHEAWAIIRRSTRAGDRDTVGLVGGRHHGSSPYSTSRSRTGLRNGGHVADRLLAIPFRQVAERGFEAHDDGTPQLAVLPPPRQPFDYSRRLEVLVCRHRLSALPHKARGYRERLGSQPTGGDAVALLGAAADEFGNRSRLGR